MTNHVHLLVTPKEIGGVSKLMQSLGRRYVPYFNFQCIVIRTPIARTVIDFEIN